MESWSTGGFCNGTDDDEPKDEELQALEESNFWWTLGSFAEVVKEHGVRSVLGKLNKETEEKLFQYYYHQIKREE